MHLRILQYLPFDPLGYHKEKEKASSGIAFALDQIRQHRQDVNYNNPARDYIDSFLTEQQSQTSNPETVFNGESVELEV